MKFAIVSLALAGLPLLAHAVNPAQDGIKLKLANQLKGYTNPDGTANAEFIRQDQARIQAKLRRQSQIAIANRKKLVDSTQQEAIQAQARALEQKYATKARMEKRSGLHGSAHNCENVSQGCAPLRRFNIQAVVPIEVGTPAQSFDVLLDTGSADLILAGTNITGNMNKVTIYHPNASSTSVNLGRKLELAYGSGNAEGIEYTDTVTIGGYTVKSQVLEVLNRANNIVGNNIDGFLGLAPGIAAFSGAPTFVERLINESAIPQPNFAVSMTNKGGELLIGTGDESRYVGNLEWNKVVGDGTFWSIESDGFGWDGEVINGTAARWMLDTGTAAIVPTQSAAEKAFAKIPGAKWIDQNGNFTFTWSIPCDTHVKNFEISFGGKAYSIPLDAITFGKSAANSNECVVGVYTSPINDGLVTYGVEAFILGLLYLRTVYAEFSYSHNGVKAIGLAQSKITPSSLMHKVG